MVPEGWRIKRVIDIASVFSGGTPSRANMDFYGGSIPWVKSGEINKEFIRSTEELITDEAIQNSSAKWAQRGDVLIAMYGATAGKVATLCIDATINQAIACVSGQSDKVFNPFLHYAFQHINPLLLRKIQGSGQPNLSGQIIKSTEILVPPLPEQKKIAAILSSVDDTIQATQAVIDQTHRVKQGLLQQLLTRGIGHTRFKQTEIGEIPEEWLEGTLGDYLKEIKGGGTPSRKKTTYWEGAIPWGSVKDLTGAYLDNTEEYITEEGLKNSASNLIPAGTVIIATRMALGKVIRFSCDVAINQDLKALYPIKELSSDFLFYWLLLQASLIETLGAGSTVKGIRLESLRALKLMLPPIDEQKKIVAILTGVDEVLNTEQDKMLQLNKIKKGLMQDLLTGRVRVKLDEVNTT